MKGHIILLFGILVQCILGASPDYDTILASKGKTTLAVKTLNVTGGGTQIHTQAFLALVSGISKDTYTPATEPGGCTGTRQPLSVSAKDNGCIYATNGAFFDFTAENHCLGNLMIDGVWQHYDAGVQPNFAQRGSDLSWIVGYFDNSTVKNLGISNIISGHCWLVRSGQNIVNKSKSAEPGCSSSFITLVAPRTAIGVTEDGDLILLQVDGIENTSGMSLYQFADLLVSVGAWSAINLDGGGSSTSYYNGKVFNTPHCNDTPPVCERSIASLTCVKTPNQLQKQ